MTEGELKLETPKGWAVRPIDGGTHTALVFQQHEGDPIGVALNNNDLSRFVCIIISEAAKLASTQAPSDLPEKMVADPIPVVSMGVGQGRSDTEALLAFRLGNLDMTFSVELPMLVDMCSNLQKMTVKTEPRKPN